MSDDEEFTNPSIIVDKQKCSYLGLPIQGNIQFLAMADPAHSDDINKMHFNLITDEEIKEWGTNPIHPHSGAPTGTLENGQPGWTKWLWKSSSGNPTLSDTDKKAFLEQIMKAEKTEKAERAKQAKREHHTLVLRVIDENREFFSPEGLDAFEGGDEEPFLALIDQVTEIAGYLCDVKIDNIRCWLRKECIPHYVEKTKTTLFIPTGQSKEMVRAIRIVRSCFEEIATQRRVEEENERKREKELIMAAHRKRRREQRNEERAAKRIATSKTKLTDLFSRVMKQSNVKAMRVCLTRDEVKAAWDAAYESIPSVSE